MLSFFHGHNNLLDDDFETRRQIDYLDAWTRRLDDDLDVCIWRKIDDDLNVWKWRQKLSGSLTSQLKQEIDAFVNWVGIEYKFLVTNGKGEIGTLLTLAAEHASIDTLRYIVEEKKADVNNAIWRRTALHYAAIEKRFENAIYLLEQGTDVKKYSAIQDASLVKIKGEEARSAQLNLIKQLLIKGDTYSGEGSSFFLSLSQFPIARLKEIQQNLLLENKLLRLENERLIHMSEELLKLVEKRINELGPKEFLYDEVIELPFTVDEALLNHLIDDLEKRKSALAFLICGLLLEGRLSDVIPKRYEVTDEDNALSENKDYVAYIEKRTQDALTFYTKAGESQNLKPVVDTLLWQLSVMGSEAIRFKLDSYDLEPPAECIPSYAHFKKRAVSLPLNTAFGFFRGVTIKTDGSDYQRQKSFH